MLKKVGKFINCRFLNDERSYLQKYGHLISDSCSPFKKHYISENEHAYKKDQFIGKFKTMDKNLYKMYCDTITLQVDALHDVEKEWFCNRYEQITTQFNREPRVDKMVKNSLLLLKCQQFDVFLQQKYSTAKRYGGEGLESANVMYKEMFEHSANFDVKNIFWCMAHRGRLNSLALLLDLQLEKIFSKLNGFSEFDDKFCFHNEKSLLVGDVLSHLYDTRVVDGVKVHLLPNSSHLEAVNSIAMGMTRGARNTSNKDSLCLQVHGDGSVVAQGCVAETLNLSKLPGFTIDGSIHIVLNNLLSFTTEPHEARSTRYATDVSKMMSCPVIHVNAYDIEGICCAAKLAFEYRNKFKKDVFVEIVGFRKHGHNEMDEARFTNPLLYREIDSVKSIPDQYYDNIKDKLSQQDEQVIEENLETFQECLKTAFNNSKLNLEKYDSKWPSFIQPVFSKNSITIYKTGIDKSTAIKILRSCSNVPENFKIHPNLLKSMSSTREQLSRDFEGRVDWATAETLAIGSLLLEKYHVRICGQEAARGTFSQRHAVLTCQTTGEKYIPFTALSNKFEIVNSPLSEFSVLGFEYGISVEKRSVLVIWEAQFGDFANGAQTIIDAFISGGEAKWAQQSSIVLLLPHGLDGAGSEHSSARLERYLQLSNDWGPTVNGDNVNMFIINPSTAAQYFHALRRQMLARVAKPLVVMTPKSLLKSDLIKSHVDEFMDKGYFKTVLDHDGKKNKLVVKTVILTSGKHYYTLAKKLTNSCHVAIIRIEQFSPFPAFELKNVLSTYPNADKFVWSQEEHLNSGAWSFINDKVKNVYNINLIYNGRNACAAPATGIKKLHIKEMDDILNHLIHL